MKMPVRELMIKKFARVAEDDPIYELVVKVAEDRETMVGCVVDREGRLKGIITPKELLRAVEVREFGAVRYPFFEASHVLSLLNSKYARDIMSAAVAVRPEDDVDDAIRIMLDKGFYEVPVVDKDRKLLGTVSYFDIITSCIECLGK